MMILIDVLVPPLDEIFDFEVDETIDAQRLRKDVEGLIENKRKVKFSTSGRELFLYREGEFLKEQGSLKSQGLINGDRLILI